MYVYVSRRRRREAIVAWQEEERGKGVWSSLSPLYVFVWMGVVGGVSPNKDRSWCLLSGFR